MATLSEDTTIGGKTIAQLIAEQIEDAEEEVINSLTLAQSC